LAACSRRALALRELARIGCKELCRCVETGERCAALRVQSSRAVQGLSSLCVRCCLRAAFLPLGAAALAAGRGGCPAEAPRPVRICAAGQRLF
jgi:hypothetical protein